jgi:hypothetical protein
VPAFHRSFYSFLLNSSYNYKEPEDHYLQAQAGKDNSFSNAYASLIIT